MGKIPNQYFCCLYRKNYLYVTSNNNSFVRVWDLINKVIYKQIEYKTKYQNGYEIALWNCKYYIVGAHTAFL